MGCGSIYGVYRGMWFYIGDVQRDVVLYRGVYSGMWFYIGGCTEGCGSI